MTARWRHRRLRGRPWLVIVSLALLLGACGGVDLPFTGSPTPEQPREVTLHAVTTTGGSPVPNATVTDGAVTATTDANGVANLTAVRGTKVTVTAVGHDDGTGTVPGDGDLTVQLRPNVLAGTITDEKGAPLAGVRVFVDGQQTVVRTDKDGHYALPGVPTSGSVVFKRAGYRLTELPIPQSMSQDMAMQPFTVRALYAPASVFERTGGLDAMLKTIADTEMNAMVIDVKEGTGNLYYATDLPQAKAAGAVMKSPLLHLDTLIPMLHAKGIYVIARMVVMKDDTLGKAQPSLAVQNSKTGKAWTDYHGDIWLDPNQPEVANYIASIAGDLAAKGFDEVQMDYVRFFSDGDYSTAQTVLPNTQSFRLPAIRRLFRIVSGTLAPTRAMLGADVFPISFIAADDQGIGQRPEVIMPYVDYFDPMVYPSHYAPYTWGYANPNEHPYEIISKSLQRMIPEAKGLPMVIRPWIQDFGFGPYRAYTAADIHKEMKALADNGATGFMIWNAAARFTVAALGPPQPDEASAPVTSPIPIPTTSAQPSASASASASAEAPSPAPSATP